jgi:hypothetical protein
MGVTPSRSRLSALFAQIVRSIGTDWLKNRGRSAHTNDDPFAVVRQPDGKLVIGGSRGYRFFLRRCQRTGFLERSFGSGGPCSPRSDPNAGRIEALASQPDGAIVAA